MAYVSRGIDEKSEKYIVVISMVYGFSTRHGVVLFAKTGYRVQDAAQMRKPASKKSKQALMKTAEYKAAIKGLGLTHVGAAPILGISRRQAQRLVSGHSPVPGPIAKLLRFMEKFGVDAVK